MGLDMARGSLKACGALIQVAVNMDMAEFPVLEAGFMIVEIVTSKGCIMVTAGLPDFGVSDGDFFFSGQRRQ